MCGIAGVIRKKPGDCEGYIRELIEHQAHRGPDDSGLFVDGNTGLSHRRLAIIDPESEGQPLSNEDGSIYVSFNGEIYNHAELRTSLQNHEFKTDTDTEVIVHLYEEFGLDFLSRLDGMFALALWDSTSDQMLLARDPSGIKPLHVLQNDDLIAFSSELLPLVKSTSSLGGLNRDALSIYFRFGFIPSPHTAFNDIRKLRAGERAVITTDGATFDTFYTPTYGPVEDSYTEAKRRVRSLVIEAVRKRLMSDVPLGAFLSGGLDSTIVVGIMANLIDEPVQTFNIGFEERLFDQSRIAREVAEYHGTDHHEYVLSAGDVQDLVPRVLSKMGEPFAGSSILPTYLVSRETSNTVKVALSGDGADEVFGGYNKYHGELVSRQYQRIPPFVRSRFIEPIANHLPASRGSSSGEAGRKLQKFVRIAGKASGDNRHHGWLDVSNSDVHANTNGASPESYLSEQRDFGRSLLPPELSDDQLALMMETDTRAVLPDDILKKVDRASMYNSLEVRVPFLDRAVVEYVLSLPTEYRITRNSRKRILREAFEDYIPEIAYSQKKRGFGIPIGEWFKNELYNDFLSSLQTIDQTPAIDDSIIDVDGVESLFRDHCSEKVSEGDYLWAVYVFGKWLGADYIRSTLS